MSGINRDAWLAALQAVEAPCDPDAITRDEFAALIGLKKSAALDRLRRLVEIGSAQVVKKKITDSAGRSQSVNAYRLVKETPDVRHARARPEDARRRRAAQQRAGRSGLRRIENS